mgnify:FL=1
MTSVTSALIKVFASSGFECELIEAEKEDQVRIPITGDTFGPRLMVVRFPHEGDYMAVFLPDLLEIPKGKASTALKVANELHRSSHLVKFWVDKKNRSLWAMINTFIEEETAVDTAGKAVGRLVDYCNRMCPVFESAMNEG